MALGIISRTCTSPGIVESTWVTGRCSPEFHLHLSQKQHTRQEETKSGTPARLHHGELSLIRRELKKKKKKRRISFGIHNYLGKISYELRTLRDKTRNLSEHLRPYMFHHVNLPRKVPPRARACSVGVDITAVQGNLVQRIWHVETL